MGSLLTLDETSALMEYRIVSGVPPSFRIPEISNGLIRFPSEGEFPCRNT